MTGNMIQISYLLIKVYTRSFNASLFSQNRNNPIQAKIDMCTSVDEKYPDNYTFVRTIKSVRHGCLWEEEEKENFGDTNEDKYLSKYFTSQYFENRWSVSTR